MMKHELAVCGRCRRSQCNLGLPQWRNMGQEHRKRDNCRAALWLHCSDCIWMPGPLLVAQMPQEQRWATESATKRGRVAKSHGEQSSQLFSCSRRLETQQAILEWPPWGGAPGFILQSVQGEAQIQWAEASVKEIQTRNQQESPGCECSEAVARWPPGAVFVQQLGRHFCGKLWVELWKGSPAPPAPFPRV